MPPPRAKLHYKTGKLKTVGPYTPPTPTTSTTTTQISHDTEADQQFEVELCWCIHQLENSLISGKLNPKQVQDTEKALKALKSSTQPLIKKRQLMRTTFGDYRAKMAEEEKKMSLASRQIKFAEVTPKTKFHFVKKSALLQSGKDFKFNFPIEEIQQLNISEDNQADSNNDDKDNTEPSQENNSSNFRYLPSGNTFRFNFAVEE